jgi:hypothetical protein
MRASDLDMKIDYLRRRNGKRVVAFATATPIANSVTEAYVMQRYLRPDLLDAAGISVFDTWAATFGQVVTEVELAPEGGNSFRLKSRFARFRNVPEMLRMWHVSADVKTAEDLKLPTPLLAQRPGDGQRAPQTVITAPSEELLAYVAELGRRAEAVRGRAVMPDEDNMLKITGDGRKAALDLRLVGLPQVGPSKVDAAADQIAAIWAAHRDDVYPGPGGVAGAVRGSLQLVFCDLGTPGDGWNVYDYLRGELVAQGVPRERIRFVHEARTDRDKAELFAACRAGRVAVLIGSTEKMGVGTNVQIRVVALHHLDAPWRPADVAQREGRILRQGNLNPEVRVYRHVVRQSFDGYLWQTLERKSRFITQVMRGRLDVREIEDIGDATLSYTEVKALATGNPMLMDKAKADAELTRLERAERAHHRNQDALRYTVTRLQARIAGLDSLTRDIDVAVARRRDTRGDAFAMQVDGVAHSKRAEAGQRLKRVVLDAAGAVSQGERRHQVRLGQLGGFEVTAEIVRVLGTVEVSLGLDGAPGPDIRMTLADLSGTDPAGLVIRLENRLARLEDHKADVLAEIGRLRAELTHANDSIGQPFPQASQLASARDRSRQIEDQLRTAAESPQPAEDQQAGSSQAEVAPKVSAESMRQDTDEPALHSHGPADGSPEAVSEDVRPLPGAAVRVGRENDSTQGGDDMDHDETGIPSDVSLAEPHDQTASTSADRAGPIVGRGSREQDRSAREAGDQRKAPDQSEDRSGPADRDGPTEPVQDLTRSASRDQSEDHPPVQAHRSDQMPESTSLGGSVGSGEEVQDYPDQDHPDQDHSQADRQQDEDCQPAAADERRPGTAPGGEYGRSGGENEPAQLPPPGPLTDTDIAVALRRMPARDFSLLLQTTADDARAWSATIHGSLTSRGPDQPDPGAFDELNFSHTGIRMRVSMPSITREGFLPWRRVTRWLDPGVTDARRHIVDRAARALTSYRTSAFTDKVTGSGDTHQREAAIDELTGILTETTHTIIDAALHAHERGSAAQVGPQRMAARDRPDEWAPFGAPDTGVSAEDNAALERIEQLAAALPGSERSNAAVASSGQGTSPPAMSTDPKESAMDDQPEPARRIPAATADADLDQGFGDVIDALTERVPPPPHPAPQRAAGDDAYADIRAAFTELRQALGLPQEDGFHPATGPGAEPGSDATSIQRLGDALAEAHACANWYRDAPEWQRITKVSDAARALLAAIREAAGDYWAEVSQDIRVRGFARTVTARVARVVSGAADSLARRLGNAGQGHTRAGQAVRNLQRCAAQCADKIMKYPAPSSDDRMSEVAEVIAELRRSPQGMAANGSSRSSIDGRRSAGLTSPAGLARNCFPRSPKLVTTGRRTNRTARRTLAVLGDRARQRGSSWRFHR